MTGLAVVGGGGGSPSRSIKAHSRESLSCFSTLNRRVMYVKIPDSMKTLDSPAERRNAHQLFKSQSAHGSVSVTSLVNPFVSSEMCHVSGYETSRPP